MRLKDGWFKMTIHALKKKIIRIQAQRAAVGRTETRDAVLWDVIPEQKLCRVKVLGSNTLIECKYPENWSQTPTWLKPRTAVRIQHRGGNRHSFEVVGDGLFIPTPIINPATGVYYPSLPDIAVGVDTVFTDCLVFALETPGMQVWVKTGTFRINGIIYTTDYMDMSESNVADMSSGVPMDQTVGVYNINAAHATLWRMDRLVIGSDLVVDVLTGDNVASNPEPPETTVNHVSLNTILIPPGITGILQTLIGRTFEDPYIINLEVTVDQSTMSWATETTSITLAVKDQYGNPFIGSSVYIVCSITSGSGTLNTDMIITNSTTGEAEITYTREDGYAESSANIENGPVFLNFTLSNDPNVLMIATIILNDAAGDPIL